MELAVAGDGVEVTKSIERQAAEHAARLKDLFVSETDVDIRFSTALAGRIVTEGSCQRAATAHPPCEGVEKVNSALRSAVKKAEWKYRMFWIRGSFRFSGCC